MTYEEACDFIGVEGDDRDDPVCVGYWLCEKWAGLRDYPELDASMGASMVREAEAAIRAHWREYLKWLRQCKVDRDVLVGEIDPADASDEAVEAWRRHSHELEAEDTP